MQAARAQAVTTAAAAAAAAAADRNAAEELAAKTKANARSTNPTKAGILRKTKAKDQEESTSFGGTSWNLGQ